MLIDKFITAIKPHVDLKSVKTIFDIGSRDLEQSLELLSVFPDAHIYAFEANPDSYAKCVEAAKGHNITVFPYAVLDYDGETTFYKVPQDENHGASSVFEPTDFVVGVQMVTIDKITVPTKRIDTWAKEQGIESVDLVWADTQGCELPVFKSFGPLFDTVQAVATEVETGPLYYPNRKHKPTQYQELKSFLTEHGFTEVDYDQPWPLEADVVYARVK